MAKTFWIPLTLTEKGEGQPVDCLVRMLHGAGVVASKMLDLFTFGYGGDDFCNYLISNKFLRHLIVCRVNNSKSWQILMDFLKKHTHLFVMPKEEDYWKIKDTEIWLKAMINQVAEYNQERFKGSTASKAINLKGNDSENHYADWNEIDGTLRPYQIKAKEDILSAWQKVRHVMMQMPTGTGKTRLFVSLIADIRKNCPDAKVLIVTHRKELVEQISHSLSDHYHLSHGILAGNLSRDETENILVASIQTLKKRGSDCVSQLVDYIIVDEAHHSLASSYKELWDRYPQAKKLGVTATPCRLRKTSFTQQYDVLIESQPMRLFIDEGYLANYRYFTVSSKKALMQKINRLTKFGADGDYQAKDLDELCNTEEEIEFLSDCYADFAKGRKGIVYAVNQAHSQYIASCFREHGVVAASVDCNTPARERSKLLDAFRKGELQVLVNVDLFTEGFDCPSIDFVMLARPTRSLSLYLQQVGRALRPSPNGEEVLILDTVGLQGRFGFPDRKRDWMAHFRRTKSKMEDYTKPLGNPNISPSLRLLEEVIRKPMGGVDTIEATKYDWSICRLSDKQTILDKNQRSILKKSLLMDLKEDIDGNYSAFIGTKEYWFNDKRPIRFTPSLQLIPERTRIINGMLFYAFDNETYTFIEGKQAERIHTMGYTLSLDLDSLLFDKVQAWNTEWVVLEKLSNSLCYTNREIYPKTEVCTIVSIGEKQYISTEGFIVGNDNASEFYHRLPHGMYLYYRIIEGQSILYNAQLEAIWMGTQIEILHDGLILHKSDGTTQKVLYLDLIFGNVRLSMT